MIIILEHGNGLKEGFIVGDLAEDPLPTHVTRAHKEFVYAHDEFGGGNQRRVTYKEKRLIVRRVLDLWHASPIWSERP